MRNIIKILVILTVLFMTSALTTDSVIAPIECRDSSGNTVSLNRNNCINAGHTWCNCYFYNAEWSAGEDICGAGGCGARPNFCGDNGGRYRDDCPSAGWCGSWECTAETSSNFYNLASRDSAKCVCDGVGGHVQEYGECQISDDCCDRHVPNSNCWERCGTVCRTPLNIDCTCTYSGGTCGGSCCENNGIAPTDGSGFAITRPCDPTQTCCVSWGETFTGCYEPTSTICNTWPEYQCVGGDVDGCGATLQTRTNSQYCPGTSEQCTGSISNGGWSNQQVCGATQVCDAGVPECRTDLATCPDDTTAPTTTIQLTGNLGNNGWYVSNVQVQLTCNDGGGSGCDTTYYCVDTANTCNPTTVYSSQFTISNQGTRYVRYYSTDNAGNTEATKSATVRIDTTDPTVSVTGAPGSWQNTDATADANCADTGGSGLEAGSCKLRVYNSNPGSCSTTYSGYTLNSPQTIPDQSWVCGAARDNAGNEGFSSPPVWFRIDKQPPIADFANILPEWTIQNSVVMDFAGSDQPGYSGIDHFELQYRITYYNDTVIQGWTAWGSNPTNPGSLPFSGMQNLRKYHFRVRAVDNAGNIGVWSPIESVKVDLGDPTCTMGSLPAYSSSIFQIDWLGQDGESGVDTYDVQARATAGGCGIPTTWGILDGLDDTSATQHSRGYQDGCTYEFRCRTNDVAGRTGSWSAVESTTVDVTAPVSQVNPLTRWLNVTSFAVSWSSTGICTDIQWDDGSGWNDWFSCITNFSADFGPAAPANVADNTTYYFRSRTRDNAGNVEAWPAQADAYTTIDLNNPTFDLRAYDQDGNEINGTVSPADVTSVTLESTATDETSGILNNIIIYSVMNDSGDHNYQLDCGSASPYEGVSNCQITIPFSEGTTIIYGVSVEDRAGNSNGTGMAFNIGTHSLANFAQRNLFIVLGRSAVSQIYVRNNMNTPDNITVQLQSNLPVNPYFIGLGNLKRNNTIWEGDDVELRDSNMTIIVKNMNPGDQRIFNVLVWSGDPDVYQMTLDAASAADAALTDNDLAVVQIGYPASFPGLNEWAILVLIALAVIFYFMMERKKFFVKN